MPPCSYAGVTAPEAAWSTPAVTGVVARHDSAKQHPNSDYEQAGTLFRVVMSEVDRQHLVDNLVDHLKNARRDIQGAWRFSSLSLAW